MREVVVRARRGVRGRGNVEKRSSKRDKKRKEGGRETRVGKWDGDCEEL